MINSRGTTPIYVSKLPHARPCPGDEVHLRQTGPLVLLDAALLPLGALGVDLGHAADEVSLLGLDPAKEGRAALVGVHDLAEEEHEDAESHGEVGRDEAADAEGGEDVEADEDDCERADDEGEDRGVGSPGSGVGEGVLGDSLGLAGAPEAEVGDEHPDVGGDEGGGGQVNEPEEDFDGGVGGNEEGDAGDEGDDGDGDNGDTVAGALHEELGSLTV